MTHSTPSKQDHEEAKARAEEILQLAALLGPYERATAIARPNVALARCYLHNRDQLTNARVTISRRLQERVEAAERTIEIRDAQVIAAVSALMRSEAIEADCASFLADLIVEGRWREFVRPKHVTVKYTYVQELKVGDLFDYVGSFRILQVTTQPDTAPGWSPLCVDRRLVFRVKNVSTERQHEFDIRLPAALAVQLIEKMP
jgi:hypothetical protein